MNTQPDFAVRVQNISKIYHLWNSSKDRLLFPIKRLLSALAPSLCNADQHAYSEFYALKNINLDIRKGESWGFVGVNGSGKSTLLKIISGNIRPSAGRAEVDGKVVILDYGSGFNGEFTGRDNIYIKAALLGLTKKQISERFNSIVEFAELGDFIDQPVKTYSSGMVSRLGFAIITHVDADIIITDEALAVGDVFFVQKCMRFIRQFLKKGTFLFVSHSTNDVLSLCQNAVWLEHGEVKSIGAAPKVIQAYLDKTHLDNVKEAVTETKSVEIDFEQLTINSAPKSYRDARLDFTIKNNLTIPSFETDGSHDIGGAKILKVTMFDEQGQSFRQIIGGELVTLNIDVLAEKYLSSPVVSFQVLDRLGQILFTQHSYLSTLKNSFTVDAGITFTSCFKFQMPLLPPGDYVIRAAVALIDENHHVSTLHTANNAMAIHSVTSGARHGLVGVPMLSIKFLNLN